MCGQDHIFPISIAWLQVLIRIRVSNSETVSVKLACQGTFAGLCLLNKVQDLSTKSSAPSAIRLICKRHFGSPRLPKRKIFLEEKNEEPGPQGNEGDKVGPL